MLLNPLLLNLFRSGVFLIACMWLTAPVAVAQELQLSSVSSLKYLNTFVLPHNLQFKKTTVGGLSSIDYDPKSNTYYMVCDDRSHRNPARFYKAKIELTATGITEVKLTGTYPLRQPDGSFYPEIAVKGSKTSDPEAMRYNPLNKTLVWTSEGERIVTSRDTILINPAINIIAKNGKYVDSIPLPVNLRMEAEPHGPRRNGVLEGLTFADNFKSVLLSLEEPLYQDGPEADLMKNKAFVRIYKIDLQSKKNTAQYAYELEPIAFPPTKSGGSKNNGIPDILSIGQNQLLVTERSFGKGRVGANIKVFLAQLTGAENIIGRQSMIVAPAVRAVQKKLLLNMDDLLIFTDNVEGATIGPTLPNGHQTIIFVTDNNFNVKEQTQFLAFEVIP
jgi:hypothetical protein